MSIKYKSEKYVNQVTTITASNTVLIGPVNIQEYDKFCLVYQNNHTAIGFLDLQVQASFDTTGTVADLAPHWFQINTGTLPQPSALGATAVIATSAVDNAYKWIRVMGRTSSTAIAGKLTVTIGGFQRVS